MSERQQKSSLTKQVKKGLSNIVNRSSKNSNSTNSVAEVNAKKFKLASAAATTTSKPEKKTKKSLDLAGSQSLPSSQNEKIVIKEDLEESEYESAEENPSADKSVVHRYEPPA